jgi:hypothetical protein
MSVTSRKGKFLRVLGVLGGLAALWMLAGGTESKPAGREKSSGEQVEPGRGGMRAYIDPRTGQLVEQPEYDEMAVAAPGEADRTPFEPSAATELVGPDGAVGMVLDESMMTFSVATVGPDGSISITHAGGGLEALERVHDRRAETEKRDDR